MVSSSSASTSTSAVTTSVSGTDVEQSSCGTVKQSPPASSSPPPSSSSSSSVHEGPGHQFGSSTSVKTEGGTFSGTTNVAVAPAAFSAPTPKPKGFFRPYSTSPTPSTKAEDSSSSSSSSRHHYHPPGAVQPSGPSSSGETPTASHNQFLQHPGLFKQHQFFDLKQDPLLLNRSSSSSFLSQQPPLHPALSAQDYASAYQVGGVGTLLPHQVHQHLRPPVLPYGGLYGGPIPYHPPPDGTGDGARTTTLPATTSTPTSAVTTTAPLQPVTGAAAPQQYQDPSKAGLNSFQR